MQLLESFEPFSVYWRKLAAVINRRRTLAIVTSLIVLAALLITYRPPEPYQRIEMRFIVSQPPLDSTTELEEERYNLWVNSEYVVYSISDAINGTQFAKEVSRRMIASGYDADDFDTQTIDDSMYSSAVRSRLLVGVLAEDEKTVLDMAEIVSELVQANAGDGIPQLERQGAQLYPIDDFRDESMIAEVTPEIGDQLSLPVRLLLGLTSGIALAFLLDYLDPTIRHRRAVKPLDMQILAEIPQQ